MDLERELGSKLLNGIKINEPMSLHTSWKVGGPADYFLIPASQGELVDIVRYASDHDLPLFVFGNRHKPHVAGRRDQGIGCKYGATVSISTGKRTGSWPERAPRCRSLPVRQRIRDWPALNMPAAYPAPWEEHWS